jgi:hypothetical protein
MSAFLKKIPKSSYVDLQGIVTLSYFQVVGIHIELIRCISSLRGGETPDFIKNTRYFIIGATADGGRATSLIL